MLRQAVVLVGGLGTRLGELTASTPKPMLPIGDEPFLDILLRNLARHGLTEALLLSRHQAGVIREHYERHPIAGMTIDICEEAAPAGTAGALRECADRLDDVFLLTNGDSLFDVNYLALHRFFRTADVDLAIALCRVRDVSRYAQVTLNAAGRVERYADKQGRPGEEGLISGGVYVVSRRIVADIGSGMVSLETDVIPNLVARGRVGGVEFSGYFIDIGLPESYGQAQIDLPAWERRPAVFLDRDGTINRDEGHTHRPEDLEFLPGVTDAIRAFNDAGRLVIVISNQAGVARGYYTPAHVDLFHDEMRRQLQACGAHIDAFYFCPHHPDGAVSAFAISCDCRKPGTALLRAACAEWKIDRERSVMIGDKQSDIEAAEAFGIAAIKTDGNDMYHIAARVLRSCPSS